MKTLPWLALLFIVVFSSVKPASAQTPQAPTVAIVLVCGNAFGACRSTNLVAQIRAVLPTTSVAYYPVSWGGVKWNLNLVASPAQLMQQPVLKPIFTAISQARKSGATKVLVAGQSAGGWAATLAGILANVDGIISFYGALDLPTLWQRSEWGKINSPRGPLLLLMPWGYAGCDDCNNPFPRGDGPDYFYNVSDASDPNNSLKMRQLLAASPWQYFRPSSPPIFATQGGQDGIIGQYNGTSQAERFLTKHGARPQDALVLCPDLAHGYAFNGAGACTNAATNEAGSPGELLTQWMAGVLSR